MSGANEREMAAYDRLRDAGLGHTCLTLRVLVAHALAEHRDDDHPKGWVAASNVWLQQRSGRSENTITGHVAALIKSGELVVWEPARPRSGRSREYLIPQIAGAQVVKRAEMRAYRRNHDSIRSKGQHPQYYPQSTTGDDPLNALPADRVEAAESRETVVPQRSAPAVSEIALLVGTRQSGKDNHRPETVATDPADPGQETRTHTPTGHLDETPTLPFQSRVSAKAHHQEHNPQPSTTEAGTRILRQVATIRSTRGQEHLDVATQ